MSTEKSLMHEILSEDFILKHNNRYVGNMEDHYNLIATNRFKWTGLPEGIESYKIEHYLYTTGQVAFYDDALLGLICLPCDVGGNLNVYNEPVALRIYGIGYSNIVNIDDCVRIKANDKNKPLKQYVDYYIYLLYEIERIKLQNLRQQRFPYLIPCNKNTELTLKKMFEQIDTGEEAIFVDEKLSMSENASIQVIETKAPYLLDKLQIYKKDVESELYTILGVNNTSNEKRERMIVDEVNVNNGQILMNLETEYKHRIKACEEINSKYGLNVKVEKVIDVLSLDFLGGVKDGQIHTGSEGTTPRS